MAKPWHQKTPVYFPAQYVKNIPEDGQCTVVTTHSEGLVISELLAGGEEADEIRTCVAEVRGIEILGTCGGNIKFSRNTKTQQSSHQEQTGTFPLTAHGMSKKDQKQQKVKKPSVPNRDGFARASFLFQAAHVSRDAALSRMYIRSMDLVTKRSVLKVSPHVKRGVCKHCDRLQTPGQTCSINVEDEEKKSEVLEIRCLCGTRKRFPVGNDRDYVLFVDKTS